MSIKADIFTDANGNIRVHMKGGLNYETSAPLHAELSGIAKDNPRSIIYIDLSGVDFVGSSGIGHFVQTLNQLGDQKSSIKLLNVKPEFQRVFQLYQLKNLQYLLDDFELDETPTEELASRYAGRGRTFEN